MITMENTQLPVSSPSRNNDSKHKTTGLMLFLLGLIVGIVGVCVAFKLIFWIGLVALVVGICVIIYWGLKARRDIRNHQP